MNTKVKLKLEFNTAKARLLKHIINVFSLEKVSSIYPGDICCLSFEFDLYKGIQSHMSPESKDYFDILYNSADVKEIQLV